MSYKELSEDEIVHHHLTLLKDHDAKTVVFSSLVAALRDARQTTGRDLETGKNPDRFNNSQKSNWLGTLCYLIILDQLGKCYKAKSDPDLKKISPIQRCLKLNTQLPDEQIDAVYALRNAFAHDYSISNKNDKHPSLRHHFTLLGFYSDPIIKLPTKAWDGQSHTKTKDNMTYIGLPWIGEIVETIYETIVKLHKENNLQIVLDGGAEEIRNRYLLFASDN